MDLLNNKIFMVGVGILAVSSTVLYTVAYVTTLNKKKKEED